MIATYLLIAYAFVGCAYWLWLAVAMLRIVRAVPILASDRSPEPSSWPKVSIVVPACNEAASLESAASTMLRQDYPDFEVILVDDRSTDATGAIVDRLAAADPRVRAIHVTQLPDGWLGKVHALSCGLDRSTGDWILLTDADVHMTPDMLRRAVAYCGNRGLDHLAAVPDFWHSSFLLDAVVSTFLRTFPVGTRCWAIEDPKSDAFIGVGAFNLVRRAAWDRTEGFAWLRLEVADDLGLGLMMKRSGARSGIASAVGLLGLHWYASLADMAAGVEKGYASVGYCSVTRMAAISATLLAMEWAPVVALLPLGISELKWPGLVMAVAAVVSIVVTCRWNRRPILPALLFPVAAALAAAMLLRSAWLGFRRGGIAWRGTLYSREQLAAGRRVRLPEVFTTEE